MGVYTSNYGANYQKIAVITSAGVINVGDMIAMHTDNFGDFIVRADN